MKIKFIKLAQKMSRLSTHSKARIGAVIANGSREVSRGYNSIKTHTRSNTPYEDLHAEASAIVNAGFREIRGCDIYVYRENKNGEMAISKPCIYCQDLIKRSGIRRVIYTTECGIVQEKVV